MVRRLVVDAGVRSMEGLLARLPPSLRSRYVLIFESRSVQEATYVNPRVVLYTSDAEFVIAYNGDVRESGYRSLETLEFDERTRSFRLRELVFPTEGDRPANVVVSEDDPPRCLVCHGDDPKPIWDAYPEWPGVYGEVEHHRASANEVTGMAAFLTARRSNARYALIFDAGSLAARAISETTAAYDGRARPSRNAELGVMLQRLAYRAIARRVTASALFTPFRYALLAALDPQCADVDAFIPLPVRARFPRSEGAFERETERVNAVQNSAKRERMRGGERGEPTPTETLGPFRYVVEQGLKIPTRGWALALEREAYDFTTWRASAALLEAEVLDVVARDEPRLRTLRSAPERRDGYCASLRRSSLAALSAVEN